MNTRSKFFNHIFAVSTFGRYKKFIHYGSFGTGKTYSCCVGLGCLCRMLQSIQIIGLSIVLCGRTQQTVKTNICNTLSKLFGEDFKYDSSRKDGITKTATLFGQYIYIIGFNDSKAEERFRGLTDIFCVLHDECTLCSKDQFSYMLGRIRGDWSGYNFPDGIIPGFYVGTCNPDSPTHFIKQFIDSGDYDSLLWTMNNACWDGAKDYYDGLINDYKSNPLMYRRYLLGEWVSAEGQIYASFDPDKHVLSSSDYNVVFNGFDRLIIGLDVGSNHPTAIVLCGVNDETYVVLETYKYRRTPLSDIAIEVAKIYDRVRASGSKVSSLFIDPAGASMKDELHKIGIDTINAMNSHIEGIRCIDSKFARDEIYIMDTCEELIGEIGSYVWKENSTKDEINKVNDDCCDALRYAIYTDSQMHKGVSR